MAGSEYSLCHNIWEGGVYNSILAKGTLQGLCGGAVVHASHCVLPKAMPAVYFRN